MNTQHASVILYRPAHPVAFREVILVRPSREIAFWRPSWHWRGGGGRGSDAIPLIAAGIVLVAVIVGLALHSRSSAK